MLTAILLFVFIVCVACLWWQGLWGNAITLINVTFAAMLATNLFEVFVGVLDNEGSRSEFTYLLDFLALWGLFVMFLVMFRLITDLLSRYRVRFNPYVEYFGRAFLVMWIGWLVVCFTCFTLHTAPLGAAPFLESFQPEPESRNFLFIIGPDRQWLAFIQSSSHDSLSRGGMPPSEEFKFDDDSRVFDQNSDFIFKYHHRRETFEKEEGYRVNR
jgi:hypothetical protein